MAMAPLLKQVASMAVRFGVTPRELSDILKLECVHEAAQHAKLRNGRVNHSRVSVMTGLARAEIARLLAPHSLTGPTWEPTSRHRAWRLVAAWLSDPALQGNGSARRMLSLSAPRSGFAEIARKYCGDVPEKAVLDELLRIGAVEIVGNSIALKKDISRVLRRDVGRAKPIIHIASELLQRANRSHASGTAMTSCVVVPLMSQSEHAVKIRQVELTLKAALNAIQSLSEKPAIRGMPRSRRPWAELSVSIIVSTSAPIKIRRRQREAR